MVSVMTYIHNVKYRTSNAPDLVLKKLSLQLFLISETCRFSDDFVSGFFVSGQVILSFENSRIMTWWQSLSMTFQMTQLPSMRSNFKLVDILECVRLDKSIVRGDKLLNFELACSFTGLFQIRLPFAGVNELTKQDEMKRWQKINSGSTYIIGSVDWLVFCVVGVRVSVESNASFISKLKRENKNALS